MKRIGALVCALLLGLTMMAPACMAEKTSAATETDQLKIVETSPEDGKEGAAVDNLSFTIQFDRDVQPASDAIKKNNVSQVKLVSEKNVNIPFKVYYSHDEEGLIMVAADVVGASKDKQIQGGMKYVLTLGKDFQATDGTTLGSAQTVTVKTLNQQRSMMVYMLLMVAMMGGMVFFTVRSTKKKTEKEQEEKKKKEAVNPYKAAKKSGKSVEEIVAKDAKAKAKRAEAEARLKEEEQRLEDEIREQIRREKNKRVAAPKPISAAGSTYKVKVKGGEKKESRAKTNKGTTHPKKKGGKKGKGKKKK